MGLSANRVAGCASVAAGVGPAIQHCNDTILKNMNRRSNRAELLEVIGKLRREIPGITLRTTLIAGFPGETEEQFEDLCNFVKEVQFDRLGCFAYSAEENTVAARMDGQIEQEVKNKRAELVMQIQTGIMAQKQAEKVGQTVHVLCDGIDEENGLYLCRTTGDAPEVDGCVCVSSEEPLYPGQFYDVLVEDSDLYDLYGTCLLYTSPAGHRRAGHGDLRSAGALRCH